MEKWSGQERRNLNPDILELTIEVKELSMRFDNELGSSKYPESEGSVKRHLRKISESLDNIEKKYDSILLGDGNENSGIAGMKREFIEHRKSDIRFFGVIVTILTGIFIKVVFFN